MLSVVVLKINQDKNTFEKPDEAEWNDDKQLKLENYLKSIASKTKNVTDFFERIDWSYLTTYLSIGNQQFLQMKVDEIYEEQYATEVNNIGVGTIIEDWKNKDSSIYREVSQLIDNLNLRTFRGNDDGSLNEDSGVQSPKEDSLNKIDNQLLETNMDEDLILQEGRSNDNPNTFISPKIDLPNLTTTQRGVSLDLMHTVPRLSTEIPNQTPRLTKKRPSLSKPASVTTTNINVITKTDINTKVTQEIGISSNTNRLQNLLRKIKLKITRKVSDIPPPKSPLIVQLGDTLKGKSEKIMGGSKKDLGDDRYKPSELKKTRRLSLVGENLPLYIRKQLEANSPDLNYLENSSSQIDSASSRSLSKRQSRMHNLLENSQSLYSQSKDLSLVGSGANPDDDTMPDTSEIERMNENNDETEICSDDDKEYILPDLLARYYGGDTNEEDLITNINEIEDAFDFINVRSYDAYEEMEEEEEEEEGYNEDDEYLFKI